MYDYGARMYMPDIGKFGTHDPMSETTLDPYGYVWNNPITFIDPTGMAPETNFKLLSDGQVKRVDPNDGSEKDKSDTLYATDKKGNVDSSKSVTVQKEKASDSSVISDLSKTETFRGESLSYTTTSSTKDALNVFQFAALNSSAEWSMESHILGGGKREYAFGTYHKWGLSPVFSNGGLNLSGLNEKTIQWDMHSHGDPDGTDGPSKGFDTNDRRNLTTPARYIFRTGGDNRGTVYQYGKGGSPKINLNFSKPNNTFYLYPNFMR